MELTKKQIDFLDRVCGKEKWTLNENGKVDVDGNVYFGHLRLTEIPVMFGRVNGYFDCSDNQLTSLEFCPSKVGGFFYCHNNQLTSLEFCPSVVGGNFWCSDNQLTSLEFCPSKVGRDFDCFNNQLTSLEFCPSVVGGNFWCSDNQLTEYFKTIKEDDFPHWNILYWDVIIQEYPFLVNIGKKYINDLKNYLNKYPQTKLYLE